jgi:iron(III) transport system permease protein
MSEQASVPPLWTRPVAAPAARLSAWRARRKVSPAWTVVVALVLAVVALPVVAIAVMAAGAEGSIWGHLATTVLPTSLRTTALLLAGTGLLTLMIGTGAAWLVTMYRFPGRMVADWLLLVPLAMPTYIVAYCYSDILDFSGPVQSALRASFGWTSVREYWFPDVRSLSGAVFVLSFVLYPYVYLTARASFLQQSACALEVARTLGRTPWGAFREVALPLARPALAAGVTLVLMECLNDIGAVQHLGVKTLTVSVYDTWLQRSNLGGAAQIACVMLAMVVALLALERVARGGGRYEHTTGHYRAMPFSRVSGPKGWLMLALCLLPPVVGFGIPVAMLLSSLWQLGGSAISADFLSAAWHSVVLAVLAATVAVILGLLLAYARRVAPNGFTIPGVRLAGLGYAVPGTVLAVGLLVPLAAFDNALDGLLRRTLGVSVGLLLSGTVAALVLAYVIRFLTVSQGAIEEGFGRISPSLDAAARTLGETALSAMWRVHLPLLRPALGAAALMVFVDSMKELPATLLLRPFNFDTLATQVYGLAALEQFQEAGLAALTIVLVGLVPVLFLHRTMTTGRAGGVHADG